MSQPTIRVYRDQHGHLRAEAAGGDTAGHQWARFFETELSGNVPLCERLLAEGAAHHQQGSWKTSGNAFALSLDPAHATLRPLFGKKEDHEYVLPLAEFLSLVRQWREMLA